MYRVGIGQDSHYFETTKQKPLMLGGIKIESSHGLEGNSDGDVILHSICNAISSAIAGDSLSTWADEMCMKQGITDSREYVMYIIKKMNLLSYKIGNISIAVEAKKPIITIHLIQEMKKQIALLLQIKINQIGITFTSGKNITPFGQAKAIQVFTIVNLFTQDDTAKCICKT